MYFICKLNDKYKLCNGFSFNNRNYLYEYLLKEKQEKVVFENKVASIDIFKPTCYSSDEESYSY